LPLLEFTCHPKTGKDRKDKRTYQRPGKYNDASQSDWAITEEHRSHEKKQGNIEATTYPQLSFYRTMHEFSHFFDCFIFWTSLLKSTAR
jgi:hypothetical protein